MKKLIAAILAGGLGLVIQKPVEAAPIQCYVGQHGTYQVCDFQEVKPSVYLLTWSDGEKTVISEVQTPSGGWSEVAHVRADDTIYATGARYTRIHYEEGEWLCFHMQPGGRGDIDFCITP